MSKINCESECVGRPNSWKLKYKCEHISFQKDICDYIYKDRFNVYLITVMNTVSQVTKCLGDSQLKSKLREPATLTGFP
jgi:hypothetical protein